MKRCAQCHGKLGLGVRSRKVWNGRWWVPVRYCSAHCEALHELERYNARANRGQHNLHTSHQSAERSERDIARDASVTLGGAHA